MSVAIMAMPLNCAPYLTERTSEFYRWGLAASLGLATPFPVQCWIGVDSVEPCREAGLWTLGCCGSETEVVPGLLLGSFHYPPIYFSTFKTFTRPQLLQLSLTSQVLPFFWRYWI